MALKNRSGDLNFVYQLLPKSKHLRLEDKIVDIEAQHIRLCLTSTQKRVCCPVCQRISRRIHSRYSRKLRDLNWANCAVTLQIAVRKFFCVNPACKRQIFSERLPEVAPAWARRTQRMSEQIQAVSLALGGAAGAGLMKMLGYSFSRDSLLRCLAKLPLPTIEPPKGLGVDDFAFRRGQRYGTILVDLEQHRPIALLEDREAGTLAAWLAQHPGIEVLSRDRSKSYRQGMNQGAPNAVQVADRFHLLQNLVEPLEQVFRHHAKALKEVEDATEPGVSSVIVLPPTNPLPFSAQQHRAQRQTRYEKIVTLYQQGWSMAAIAHQVRVSVRTVQRYLKHEQFPERQSRSDCGQSPTLEPFKREILQQWNAGCYEARTLFRAIQQQGYRGSYQTVARYVRRLRQAQELELRQLPRRRLRRTLVDSKRQVLTARRAAWLVLRHPEHRNAEKQALFSRLKQHPSFTIAIQLAEAFIDLVRQRQGEQLDQWLTQALQSSLVPFRRFAESLKEDYAAVRAGLTLAVSNGQTEGQINRLKMLKRQMYGRAGLALLRHRFLLAE